MEPRNSKEVRSPRVTQMGTRRTQMRVMQRQSVGIVAVYEQDPVATDAGKRVLVFETPKGKVQVAEFPTEWQRLSDEELALIRRAAS